MSEALVDLDKLKVKVRMIAGVCCGFIILSNAIHRCIINYFSNFFKEMNM